MECSLRAFVLALALGSGSAEWAKKSRSSHDHKLWFTAGISHSEAATTALEAKFWDVSNPKSSRCVLIRIDAAPALPRHGAQRLTKSHRLDPLHVLLLHVLLSLLSTLPSTQPNPSKVVSIPPRFPQPY